jgi:hypothetical protein
MSEYHEVDLDLTDESAILESLKELGYDPIVCTDPVNLHGYMGDSRNQRAHIVIPKNQVGSASNDLGFEKVNGKYVMRISEYDINTSKFNQKEFTKNYKKNYVLNKLKKSNKFKKRSVTTKDGKIVIKLTRK